MKKQKYVLYFIILLIAVAFIALLSLAVGSKSIPLGEVVDHLLHPSTESFNGAVIQARIPRTVFGLIAGAALAISGLLMQSITRNPIADPSILGVNFGASLAVVSGITFFNIQSSTQYILFALVGAILTTILVYWIASLGQGGVTPLKLALAGATINGAISSLISMMVLPNINSMASFRFWQVGGISGVSYENILISLPFLIGALLIAIFVSPSLDAMMLGDETATGLGVKVKRTRLLATASGVILSATVTAIAGPIGFVGLMIPHMMRLLIGNNVKLLLLFSALGGAILLSGADVIGRVIAYPYEVEVGILTALIGAPVFIYVAMKTKVRAL
ncbi:FecCD family ABC transporter permease [Breznakia pachnodae]|uniref:Iron complex transport system permease protein n=1 Tax=Breznakia pachnodae TaxID=265178 RepID=A0ABU0E0G4_9FIRM|nr:iron ABC transporter permease [Breznakia pachnodae]MDQ0360369.1 iron complex transport system permease protein [Breznakia pachnodae]